MRLIDANELRDRLQNLSYDDWNQGVSTSWAEAYSEIADMINDMSTIEAEPNVETEEKTIYAWIMNKDIDGYVKTWWTENGVIGVTFVSGKTYITGANNVLIKETKG